MSKTKLLMNAILATVGALAAACGPAHAQNSEIAIAGIIDLSGGAADVGKDTLVGVQFAIEQLNKSGGILGRKIQFKYLDGASNPQRAVDQGAILVREGAKFLIAPQSSASTIAATKSQFRKS